ncbi:imm11 family protein [Pyxidicoccus sp. 3LG]
MQTEYFVIEAAASNAHPMLAWDEYLPGLGGPRPAKPLGRPVKMRLRKPVPRNPVMVDHHELPDPVLSPRLKEVLEPLELHNVQFVLADVKVKPDDVRPYWLMHVYNWIACIDRERSVLTFYDSGDVLGVRKLVLDEKVLQEIPLERRRVFCPAETPATHVFHQSIVEKVLALQPEGLRFIPVDRWSDSAAFQP